VTPHSAGERGRSRPLSSPIWLRRFPSSTGEIRTLNLLVLNQTPLPVGLRCRMRAAAFWTLRRRYEFAGIKKAWPQKFRGHTLYLPVIDSNCGHFGSDLNRSNLTRNNIHSLGFACPAANLHYNAKDSNDIGFCDNPTKLTAVSINDSKSTGRLVCKDVQCVS
jgi:hypothetical protein